MALTDIEIKSAKAGARIVKLSDGKGLQLHVMPTGSKLWRYAFRFRGVQKTLALGSYPDITLAAARRLHAEAMDLLASGIDPAAAKQAAKRRAAVDAGNTFDAIADQLIAKKRREKRRMSLSHETSGSCPRRVEHWGAAPSRKSPPATFFRFCER